MAARRSVWMILTALLWVGVAGAQPIGPRMTAMVPPDGKGKAQPADLGVREMKVDARIVGPLAETTVTLTFHNPHGRPLAGDLLLPLPDGATVTGYALDINGVMVPGVPVEKAKARIAFEKEKRKGIDPGLVEWTKGNVFRTRVFPIPAGGNRTVSVTYVSELPVEGGVYRLPMAIRAAIPKLSLRVLVVSPEAPPAIEGDLAKAMKFVAVAGGYLAAYEAKDVKGVGELAVALKHGSPSRPGVYVQKASDGKTYFLASVPLPVNEPGPPLPPPKRVAVLWDASASRGAQMHEKELAALKAYFAGLPGTVDVDLVIFRDVAEPVRPYKVIGGRAESLLAAIRSAPFDGGTRLGCLDGVLKTKPDLILLCTDGLGTLDDVTPTLPAPTYVLADDVQRNGPLLRRIARATGGRVVDVTDNAAATASHIGRPFWGYLGAKGPGLSGILPAGPEPWKRRVLIVGRLNAERGTLTVDCGSPRSPMPLKPIEVSAAGAIDGDLLRTYWAQRKLAELLADPKANADAITALGKEYNLVTPNTSLIVLETLEQYVEHRIAPPRVLAKMREEYMHRIDTVENQRKKDAAEKLERVVTMWQGRVKWWENPPKPKPKPKPVVTTPNPEAVTPAAPAVTSELLHRPRAERDRGTSSSSVSADDSDGEESVQEAMAQDVPAGGEGRSGKLSDGTKIPQPGMAVKKWDPKGPYIDALNRAVAGSQYGVYLGLRKTYGLSPAFYFDVAEWFYQHDQPAIAQRVLTNIAEMRLESPALLRVVGYRLLQAGAVDLAVSVFEEVLRLRPEEPQSHRDLAMALEAKGENLRAAKLLYHVATCDWSDAQASRFKEVELIALMELNRLLARANFSEAERKELGIDPRLVKNLDLDVRIVLQWDADNTDMDLHVVEPTGEEAFYSHPDTAMGGHVSDDFTDGYGPEEYLLRKAKAGNYKIRVKYYGSSAAALIGPVTVRATLITNFGRPNEKRRTVTLRLKDVEEMIDVGVLEF